MQLTIEAEDAFELRAKILELAKVFDNGRVTIAAEIPIPSYPVNGIQPAPPKEESISESIAKEAAHFEKKSKGRGRPAGKKEEAPAPAVETPAEPPVVSAPALPKTAQDVASTLQKVNSKLGLPKAREILSTFGWTRLSEVRPDKYEDFVNACEKALAQ